MAYPYKGRRQPPDLPYLLTSDEVARLANMHPESIRRAVRAGELVALRPGPGRRHMRFEPDVVAAWLRNRCCDDTTQPAGGAA